MKKKEMPERRRPFKKSAEGAESRADSKFSQTSLFNLVKVEDPQENFLKRPNFHNGLLSR